MEQQGRQSARHRPGHSGRVADVHDGQGVERLEPVVGQRVVVHQQPPLAGEEGAGSRPRRGCTAAGSRRARPSPPAPGRRACAGRRPASAPGPWPSPGWPARTGDRRCTPPSRRRRARPATSCRAGCGGGRRRAGSPGRRWWHPGSGPGRRPGSPRSAGGRRACAPASPAAKQVVTRGAGSWGGEASWTMVTWGGDW